MPKKRTQQAGFGKRLQRLYARAVHGPALPEPEVAEPPQAQPTETTATPKDHTDVSRLIVAARKRARRAARNLRLRRGIDPGV